MRGREQVLTSDVFEKQILCAWNIKSSLLFFQSVLYFSLHRYDHGHYYPFSTYANYDSVGDGPGEGFSVNVPWNKVEPVRS